MTRHLLIVCSLCFPTATAASTRDYLASTTKPTRNRACVELWNAPPSNTGKGALIGGLAGGLIGGAVGSEVPMEGGTDESKTCKEIKRPNQPHSSPVR
jgi:hypothetical protein